MKPFRLANKYSIGLIWGLILLLSYPLKAQFPDIDRLKSIQNNFHIPVLSYAVIDSGRIVDHKNLGWKGDSEPIFRLGSIAKTIVSLGVFRLIDQGKLDLDLPVLDFSPDLNIRNEFESVFPLKLRHLLNHSSGFDEMHFKDYYVPTGTEVPPLDLSIRDIESELETRWAPGTRYSYSNLNYVLVALIIERTTGKLIQDYLNSEVLAPLGMLETDFDLGLPSNSTRELTGTLNGSILPRHVAKLYPGIGLRSTVTDIGKLLAFFSGEGMLGEHKFLSKESFEMLSGWKENGIRTSGPYRCGYGLSIQDPFHPLIWKAEGGVEGFSAWFKVAPWQGKGIAVLMNHSNISPEFKSEIESALNWNSDDGLDFSETCESANSTPNRKKYFSRDNSRNALFGEYDYLYGGIYVQRSDFDPNIFEVENRGGEIQFVQVCSMDQQFFNPNISLGWFGVDENGKSTFEVDGIHYHEDNPMLAKLGRVAIISIQNLEWIGFVLSILIFFLWVVGRLQSLRLLFAVVINMVPYLLAFVCISSVEDVEFYRLGQFGISSITILLLSCAIPILTAIGILKWYEIYIRKYHLGIKAFLLFQVIANSGICIFLASNGFLPFATWLY